MNLQDIPSSIRSVSTIQGFPRRIATGSGDELRIRAKRTPNAKPGDLAGIMFVSAPISVVNTLNRREHWAAKHRRNKAEQGIVLSLLRSRYGNRPIKRPLVITLERRIPKRGKAFDGDGLTASMKNVRDAVACWLQVDDAERNGLEWICTQVEDREMQHGTIGIRIEPGKDASKC